MAATGENETPLPRAIRAFHWGSESSGSAQILSILSDASQTEVYSASIPPMINLHHPNSITLSSPGVPVAGAVRIYPGSDIINMAFGDPDDFAQRDSCTWEDIRVTQQGQKGKSETFEFGLGLGDDLRRNFAWVYLEKHHLAPNPASEHANAHGARSKSWSITSHVPGISRSHTWGLNNKTNAEKVEKAPIVTTVQIEPETPKGVHFKLIDRNDGETVALILRDGGVGTHGKIVIYRDFWESGLYEEEWNKTVVLSGLAALERWDKDATR